MPASLVRCASKLVQLCCLPLELRRLEGNLLTQRVELLLHTAARLAREHQRRCDESQHGSTKEGCRFVRARRCQGDVHSKQEGVRATVPKKASLYY